MQTQEAGQARPTEGKLMDSQAAVSFLTLARYEQRVKLGMKMVVIGLHDSAPTQPRALHSEEGLLPGCIWLRHMLPGSETPLCRASRPGPSSLLNPASAHIPCLSAHLLPILSQASHMARHRHSASPIVSSEEHPSTTPTKQSSSTPYLFNMESLPPLYSYCSRSIC